jgi:monofunctional biosynthetic peptidoglycan transglycosylase
MMRRRETACPRVRPVALRDISPLLPRMVIIGEDWRFRIHHGIDFAEIEDALGVEPGRGAWATARAAWRNRDRLRGASTITQQVAKNLYLSPSRNPLRKLKEAVTALRLELALSKDRIMELYLNVIEWGPGVWGAAASEAYFGVPPSRVTAEQAAALAATLPQPRTSNPTYLPARMLARRDLILARYRGVDVAIPPALDEVELDSLPPIPPIPPIVVPVLPPASDSLLDSLKVPVDTARDTTRAPADTQSTKRSGMTRAM